MRLHEINDNLKRDLRDLNGPRQPPVPAERSKSWDNVQGVDWRPHSKTNIKQRTNNRTFADWGDFVEQLFINIENELPDNLATAVHLDDTVPYLKVRAKNKWLATCQVRNKTVMFAIYTRDMFPTDNKAFIYGENNPVADMANLLNKTFTNVKFNKNDILITPQNHHNDISTITKQFVEFVDFVGSSKIPYPKGISGTRELSTKSKVNRSNTDIRYYLGAASLIFVSTRFGMGSLLPRGGGESGSATFDIRDSIIAIGATEEAMKIYRETGKWDYREHAVPCKVIVDAGIKMTQEARPKNGGIMADGDKQLIMDIAKMIRNNLTLVYCTKEEASRIDSTYQQTMPPGFDPISGGDVLARFNEFGIKVYGFDGKPLGE